jgi:hypothetical protein
MFAVSLWTSFEPGLKTQKTTKRKISSRDSMPQLSAISRRRLYVSIAIP